MDSRYDCLSEVAYRESMDHWKDNDLKELLVDGDVSHYRGGYKAERANYVKHLAKDIAE